MEQGNLIPQGVWTLADVQAYGQEKGVCPYFTIRRMVGQTLNISVFLPWLIGLQMPFVDVIIYSFHYLLDPKVAEQVSKELSKDAIVVFDEAHNIGEQHFPVINTPTFLLILGQTDNVCIESLSIDLTRPMLDAAGRSVNRLADQIEE